MKIKNTKINLLVWLLVLMFPAVSFAQQLDPILTELISKGLKKSHSLTSNRYDVQMAVEDQNLAKSVFLPKVTANGLYTRLNDDLTFDGDTRNLLEGTQKLLIKEKVGIPFNGPFPNNIPIKPTPNIQDKNILKSSLDVDWILFSGFEASNALKASKHKEASVNYAGLAEKDKIALKIIDAYDKLALVNASTTVLATSEKYLKEQEFYVRKAIENGLATPIGRKKIELAQQQLAAKQLQANNNKTLLIEVLHQLTGEQKEVLKQINPQLHPYQVNISFAAVKRNEIKALEEAEKASLSKAQMERSALIPKVALRGHYEFLKQDLSLLDPRWYVGVGVKWNLFDGNQSKLKSKKSVIESQKYAEQLAEAEEMISLSIVKAQLNYQSALQNITMVQKEIELASETYELVNKQYKNNLASIKEVLDALTDFEKANFKLQESYSDERKAVTELLYAKGTLVY